MCCFTWIRLHQLIHVFQNQGIAEETTNTQIDTLILDNRKKLNAIIGSYNVQLYYAHHAYDYASRFYSSSLRAEG